MNRHTGLDLKVTLRNNDIVAVGRPGDPPAALAVT